MRPTILLGLFLLISTHVAGQQFRKPTREEQAAAQELYQKDKAAAIAGDWETLATLWTGDAVALPPGEQPVVGIDAIRSWLKRSRTDSSRIEVVDYSIDIRDFKVCGDIAVEWGTTTIAIKPKGASSGMRVEGNIERVLKRQENGSWKVQRAIWNMGKPVPEGGFPR